VKVVYNGAGASGIACSKFHISLGVKKENVILCDSKGVIYKGRTSGMNEFKEFFAVETDARTLADALVGADIFVGLSQGNVVTKEMVKTMAPNPIIFAMANPDPEIKYEDATSVRDDLIMATGRSDYPNQVNNVLGFPFIFRGALDVRATAINEPMKQAAAYALAALAKEEVPENVKKAYNVKEMSFGRQYIIPKPFDPRVLTWVAPAVAKAAMDTGVAQYPITDFDEYRRQLDIRMGRAERIMTRIYEKAKNNPMRIVFPEGEKQRIIKAAEMSVDYGIAKPILIGDEEIIKKVAEENGINLEGIEITCPKCFPRINEYIEEYYKLRQRKGVTRVEARDRLLNNANYFGSMMVHFGEADGLISGFTTHYPNTIKPALEIIGRDKRYQKVSGLYIVTTKKETYFLADTTVNPDPSAETLCDITLQAEEFVRNFDIKPRIAMLAYSNFGSAPGITSEKVQKALALIKEKKPDLVIDGEMQADTAVSPDIIEEYFPFSPLKEGANVLIFPNLNSGNISYKLLQRIGGAHLIGPVLQGLSKAVHVLQRGSEVNHIIDMVGIAVVDAQHKAGIN